MWRKFGVLAAVVAVICFAGVLVAQDTYELKHKFTKGDKGTVVEKMDFSLKMKITGPDGTVVQEVKVSQSADEKHADEVLEAKGNTLIRFQRKYHYSRETNLAPGMESPETKTTVFHGKLYEIAAGAVADGTKVKCLNAKLGEEDKAKLARDFEYNFYEMLFPEKLVAVGESWELDPEQLSKSMDPDEPMTVTSASGKLLGIEDFDGKRCAKVGYTIVMKPSEGGGGSEDEGEGEGEGGMTTKMTLEGTGLFALAEGRWLSIDMQGPITVSGEQGGMQFSGKGKVKMSLKAELGVADLQGGEQPASDEDDEEGDDEDKGGCEEEEE